MKRRLTHYCFPNASREVCSGIGRPVWRRIEIIDKNDKVNVEFHHDFVSKVDSRLDAIYDGEGERLSEVEFEAIETGAVYNICSKCDAEFLGEPRYRTGHPNECFCPVCSDEKDDEDDEFYASLSGEVTFSEGEFGYEELAALNLNTLCPKPCW